MEATEMYEAITLNKRDAELMKSKAGEAGFRVQRISKNTAGDIFEYCIELARGDRTKFQIILKNSGIQYSACYNPVRKGSIRLTPRHRELTFQIVRSQPMRWSNAKPMRISK
jgi:hypothetical protein